MALVPTADVHVLFTRNKPTQLRTSSCERETQSRTHSEAGHGGTVQVRHVAHVKQQSLRGAVNLLATVRYAFGGSILCHNNYASSSSNIKILLPPGPNSSSSTTLLLGHCSCNRQQCPSDECPSDECPSDECPSDECPSDRCPSDTNPIYLRYIHSNMHTYTYSQIAPHA
jgi:hypothetical protein